MALIRTLPDRAALVCTVRAVSRKPDIIVDLLCVHLGRKFAVVTVDDRCVACRSDRITECVYHIRELLDRKLQDIF